MNDASNDHPIDPRGNRHNFFQQGSLESSMSTATAPASAVVSTPAAAPAAAPTLADLSTAQLSERMTKLAERHDALKASVTEYESVKTDLAATLSELQKRLGGAISAPAKKPTTRAPRTRTATNADGKTYPSLKEVVLTILGKNPDGLDLNGIRVEVDAMKQRGEYASNAKSLSAVISQAVNALKQENAIKHDRESKKYSVPSAA